MADNKQFKDPDRSVASYFDEVFGPILFEPWSKRVIEENGPWEGRHVLNLASGVGTFALMAAEAVGPEGFVTCIELSKELMDLAKKRCEKYSDRVKFIESSLQVLDIDSGSVDFVTFKQGLQFVMDKDETAREIYRVLRDGGRVYVSAWSSVDDNPIIGCMCTALNVIGEREIAHYMYLTFDYMPESEMERCFTTAGFKDVRVMRQERELVIEGGIDEAVELVYGTPIRNKLLALSKTKQDEYRQILAHYLRKLSPDGKKMGRLAQNVLVGEK